MFSRPGQHGELIRPRDQRHFDRAVGQRSHQEAHRQVIAGDAVDLAALERADLIVARRDHRQRRPSRFGQRREQQVIDRVLVDGDAHAPQVVEAARIARQSRPHHHDLRQRPGLIEQLIAGGALLGVRQEHHVGLAGVELAHALVARAEPDLDRHAGLARERANQVDVEALRLALLVEVLVGRELADRRRRRANATGAV